MSDLTALLIYLIENLAGIIIRQRAEAYASENGLTASEMYQWAMMQRPWLICEVSEMVYRKAMDRLASWGIKAPSFVQYHEVMISIASVMSCKLDAIEYGCSSFSLPDSEQSRSYRQMLSAVRNNTIVKNVVEYEEVPVVCYDGFDRVVTVPVDSLTYDGFHQEDTAIFHQPSSKFVAGRDYDTRKYIRSADRARIFYVEGVACVNY